MLAVIIIAGAAFFLYKRYAPVRGLACLSEAEAVRHGTTVVDVRDYNDGTTGHVHMPYAYLPRFYRELPQKPLHIVAGNALDRNLAARFLRKRGFSVRSYTITNCPCENVMLRGNFG